MVVPSFSILRCFSSLPDPRSRNRPKDHLLIDIVCIAICAVIAGADDWHQVEAFGRKRQDWLKTFLSLPNGVPSHDTFERVFSAIRPAAFQGCFLLWIDCLAESALGKHVAVDGKTLRGSAGKAAGVKPLHLVSAWAAEARLTLAQVATDEKSNEITAIPDLLDLLELAGALVTIDAMGCQKAIARKVVDSGGDYLLAVKGNQENLQQDILETFAGAAEANFQGVSHDVYETEEDGHGRLERRSVTVIYDLEGIRDKDEWENLTVIGLCYSERVEGGKRSEESRLFIGSRMQTARFYAEHLRGHWGIENSCHWQLDVSFSEDDNRVKGRHAAENLALIRRLALSLIKAHKGKGSVATKRYMAALDPNMIKEILPSR